MSLLYVTMWLFIYPMWDSENQRMGMKACAPFGYNVRCIADMIGFLGLLLLFGISGVLIHRYLLHHPFESLYLLVLLVAGGVAEAYYKAIPLEILRQVRRRTSKALWKKAMEFSREFGIKEIVEQLDSLDEK